MKWLGKICHWLHLLFMGNPQFPGGSPQAERVELQRTLDSIQAVNTCLPTDSGVQAATSGLLNSCSTIASAFSVFALQVQTAICWLWTEIQAFAADADANLQVAVNSLQTQIDEIEAQLPATHIGTPTFAIDPTMGDGATYEFLPGSSDVMGGLIITLGTTPTAGGGPVGLLTFGLQFDNQIYPVTSAYPPTSAGHAFSTGFQLAPGYAASTTPVTAMTLMIGVDTADFIVEGDQFIITWNIGWNAPIP